MTLEEIANVLPNGFHDAMIRSIHVDYVHRRAKIELDIWMDDSPSPEGANRESYRSATLVLSELLLFVIEPPDNSYPFHARKALRIDEGVIESGSDMANKLPEELPEGAFTNWFYVNEWNSFMFIAAMDASLAWA